MIVKHATVALALLLAQASNAVPNMVKVKNCNNNGRKCSLDTAGFNVKNRPKDEVSQIDLGNGRAYACKSTGPPRGRGAMFHAECTSSAEAGGGKGKDKGQGQRKVKGQGGAMNAITRGKNSMGQDLLFATVNVDGEICKIHPDENGEESVVDCTPEAEFPDEGDPEEPLEEKMVYAPGHDATGGRKFRELVTDPVDEKLKRSPVPGLRGRGQHRGLVDDEGGNIDTMVVWTKHSECMNSGLPRGCERTEATENNMRAMIDLAIAETNTAYELSGIFTELRLVKAYCDETYTEASSNAFNAALYSIKGTTDGVMDDVHANRTKYGADIVAMIIDDSQYCGLAFSGPPSYERMFSVTKWSCATGYYSFGHEIGHNMGCYHDKGTMNQCTSSNYNYGWRDPQAQFRSILAYGCTTGECDNNAGNSCSRVQRFSNPTYTYDNKAIGSAEVDNARQINDVRHTIAAFETFVRDCQTASDCDDNDPCTDNVCDGVCLYPPKNCSDNNDCTEDSCTAGTCTNTDVSLSCDTGNSCMNDSCNVVGGCSSTPIPDCCGNGICEAGEETCTDCFTGPFTLTTPLCSSCYIKNGMMFDVEAKGKDIAINSLKMRYYEGSIAEVWTRSGTHVGFESSQTGWTKVAEFDMTGSSPFSMVAFPEFSTAVQFSAGSKQAFYVTLQGNGRVLHGLGQGSTSAIVSQDSNLIIYEGPAGTYSFPTSRTGPCAWNGEMIYVTGGTQTPQPTPSPTPNPITPEPTPGPTDAPVTPSPTPNPTPGPTDAPVTPPPTPNPITPNPTPGPTDAPVTPPPTPNPVTPNPTPGPTDAPVTPPPTPNPITPEPTPGPTDAPVTPPPTPQLTPNPTPPPTPSPIISTPPPQGGCGAGECRELLTTFAHNNGSNGNIFKVQALVDIVVTGFTIHTSGTGPGTVRIFDKEGDFVGSETNSAAWNEIVNSGFTGYGSDQQTPLAKLTNPVSIAAGSFHSFIIHSSLGIRYTNGNMFGSVYTENSDLIFYEGKGFSSVFGGQFTPRVWNGIIEYGMAGTQAPATNTPSVEPTTPQPTLKPTPIPTDNPTVSSAPSDFVPEVVDRVYENYSTGTTLQAAYFNVQAGEAWSKITNMKIISLNTRAMEVYYKYGEAAPFEQTPCAWKKIAETSSSWNPGYWKGVWPEWVNGFEPVVLPANEMVSFYVVTLGSGGILGIYDSSGGFYGGPFQSTAETSPVGAITMSRGRKGYRDQRFNPYPTYYKGYGMYGGLRFESMQAGSTSAPTTAPTAMFTPGALVSAFTGNMTETVYGLQFEVENLGSDDIIVSSFSVIFDALGEQHIEVWHKDGSYIGIESGCDNWNNWCGTWQNALSKATRVSSLGPGDFTSTPSFVVIVKANSTTSFTIVSATSNLRTGASNGSVNDDLLKINPASIIEDYYEDSVQTRHELSPSVKKFEGKIVYQVANSECAAHSRAAWVVLDPLSADADLAIAADEYENKVVNDLVLKELEEESIAVDEDEDKIINAVEELVEEH